MSEQRIGRSFANIIKESYLSFSVARNNGAFSWLNDNIGIIRMCIDIVNFGSNVHAIKCSQTPIIELRGMSNCPKINFNNTRIKSSSLYGQFDRNDECGRTCFNIYKTRIFSNICRDESDENYAFSLLRCNFPHLQSL